MSTVLVTGGAGFVGRHLVRALLEQKHTVHCVDSVVPGTGGIHPKDGWPLFEPRDYPEFYFYEKDCRDYFEENASEPFDIVFHLAAIVGGRLMIENNPLSVAEDLAIDAMFWKWASKVRPKKSVYFSSSAAYPISLQRHTQYRLLKEDMIDFEKDIGMPDLSYGWSKLSGEYLAKLAVEKYGLKSVVYRPFSGYGEDQDLTYPFPAICQRALSHEGKSPFIVWGSGNQMRDFIHIDDCVRGILTTLDQIDNADAINLSSGILTDFKTLGQAVTKMCGFSVDVVGMSDQPEGVFARGGDTTKQREFGFSPSIDLSTGIQRTLNYLKATR